MEFVVKQFGILDANNNSWDFNVTTDIDFNGFNDFLEKIGKIAFTRVWVSFKRMLITMDNVAHTSLKCFSQR